MPRSVEVTLHRSDDEDERPIRVRVTLHSATRRRWDGGGEPEEVTVEPLTPGVTLTDREEEAAAMLAEEDLRV
jgi:hypothetical protein